MSIQLQSIAHVDLYLYAAHISKSEGRFSRREAARSAGATRPLDVLEASESSACTVLNSPIWNDAVCESLLHQLRLRIG